MDYFLSTIDQEKLKNKLFFVFGPSEIDKCKAINQLLGTPVYDTTKFTAAKYPMLNTDSINNFTYVNVPSNLNTLDTYFKILNHYILNAINSTAQVYFLVLNQVNDDGKYLKNLQNYVNMKDFSIVSLKKDVNNSDNNFIDLSQVSSQNIDHAVNVLKAACMDSNYAYVNKLVSKELIYKTSINSLITDTNYYTPSDKEMLHDIARVISNSILDVFKSSYKTMVLKQYRKYPGRDYLDKLNMKLLSFNDGERIINNYDNVDASTHTVQQLLIIFRDLEVDDNYLQRLQFFDQVIGGIKLPKTLVDKDYFDSFLTINELTKPTETFDLDVDATTSLRTIIFSGFNISMNEVKKWTIDNSNKVLLQNTQLMLIFAFSTVTFDIDDDLYLHCDISIICPKWIVTKSCSINLFAKDGKDGKYCLDESNNIYGDKVIEDTSNPEDNYPCTSASYANPGADGANGKKGQTGYTGYNFQGIGIDVVISNRNVLTVHSKGGNGGKGSDGFRGHKGQDGANPSDIHLFKLVQLRSGRGGNGGYGGYGGWFGSPGNIYLSAGLKDTIRSITEKGVNGGNGKGGNGGMFGDVFGDTMEFGDDGFWPYEPLYGGDDGSCGLGGRLKMISLGSWADTYNRKNDNFFPPPKNRPPDLDRQLPKDEKRFSEITMKTLIQYEKSLIKYFYGKGNILKDMALDALLTLVGGGNEAMFEIGSSLSVDGLIDELILIHTCYWSFLFVDDSSKITLTATELSSLYDAFLGKVMGYSGDGDENDFKVLLNLYTSALAALNMFHTSYTVTDLEYLTVFDDIVKVKDYNQIVKSYKDTSTLNKYCDSILSDITKAENIIEQLNNLGKTYMSKLKDAINESVKTLNNAEEINQAHADDVANKKNAGIAGAFIGWFGKFFSNFGPKGQVAGAGLTVVSSIMGAATDTSQDTIKQLGNPVEYIDFDPPDLTQPANPTTISKNSHVFKLLGGLQRKADFSVDEVKKYSDSNVKVDLEVKLDSIDKIQLAARHPTSDNISYLTTQRNNLAVKKSAVDSYLKGALAVTPKTKLFADSLYALTDEKITPPPYKPSKQGEIDKPTKQKHDEDVLEAKEKLKYIKMGIGAISSLCDIASLVGQCNEIAFNAESVQKQNELFKAKNKDVQNFINTSLNKVLNDLRNMSDNFSQAGSRAELDYSRFKVKRAIDGVVAYFRGYFDNFEFSSKATLFAMFDNFNTLSATLESIYGRILDNYNQVNLARLIAALSGNDDSSVARYKHYTYFKELHMSILIAKEGNDIMYMARQLYFPDSISFNSTPFDPIDIIITNILDGTVADASNSVQTLVQHVLTSLDEVRKKQAVTKYCQTSIDKYQVPLREFNNLDSNKHCGPSFCICRDIDKIRNVLNQTKGGVNIVASISAAENPKNFEAVKFSEIYVKFYGGKSVDLEKNLGNYQFVLTSSGLYDYKYDDQIYRINNVIVSPISDYFSSREERLKATDGKNVRGVNNTYMKLKSAAPLFSPYTTWNISMTCISGQSPQNEFDQVDLKNVELHLVGVASYLNSDLIVETKSIHDLLKVSSDYDTFNISKIQKT